MSNWPTRLVCHSAPVQNRCDSCGVTTTVKRLTETAVPVATSAAPVVAAPPCVKTADAGTVAVSIKDFAFAPPEISAKVGDIIAFTNDDTATHTATLLDGGCSTDDIAPGSTVGLLFTEAGAYPFQCKIHTSMTGTITVS